MGTSQLLVARYSFFLFFLLCLHLLTENATNNNLGGAFGFLTEGGPGEAPLTLESWVKTVCNSALLYVTLL